MRFSNILVSHVGKFEDILDFFFFKKFDFSFLRREQFPNILGSHIGKFQDILDFCFFIPMFSISKERN